MAQWMMQLAMALAGGHSRGINPLTFRTEKVCVRARAIEPRP